METNYTIHNKLNAAVLAKKYGTLAALFAICIFFTLECPGVFLTRSNIITVLRQISILAVMGAGMTVIMISGGIDLSCGYNVSFCGIIAAALYQNYGLPIWLAAIGALGATFGIPNAIYIMVIFMVLIYVLLNHTKFGRNCYAMGGNAEATMMSGVNIRRTQLMAYVLSGFGMAVASLILLSRLGAAHPTAGDGYNMTCVAVVFLGSTMFREGEHNLLGSLFGALIMGILVNGMTLMNLPYYYQNIAQGAVILLAVAVSSIMRAKKK